MTEFTSEFIAKQKNLLKFPMMPSKGHWIEIDGHTLIGCGEYDAETNSSNCAPYLTVEIEEDAEIVKNCVLYYGEALDEIEKLQQRVQKLEQERQWIPVSERLPEDTRIYDVAIADYEYSWTGSCVFGKWIGESGKAILGVTHWKHRVQPPDECDNEHVNNPVHWKPLKSLKE